MKTLRNYGRLFRKMRDMLKLGTLNPPSDKAAKRQLLLWFAVVSVKGLILGITVTMPMSWFTGAVVLLTVVTIDIHMLKWSLLGWFQRKDFNAIVSRSW